MGEGILVIGAGELGLAMLDALSKHPLRKDTKINVLLRQATIDSSASEKKAMIEDIKSLGAGLEAGDIATASVQKLASIFSTYNTVVVCSGMALPSGTQVKLCQAALEAQVPRYFPWQFGMDYDIIGQGSSQDLFDEQLEVRKLLRGQQAVDWTIVSTGLFMSFLFLSAFGVVDLDKKVVRALGSWDNRITLTTPVDIGRVTADVILNPRDIGHQVVYVSGDTVSYSEVADLVDSHFKTNFTRELWGLDVLKKQMEEDPNTMVKYRDTFAQGKGVAWSMEQTVNHQRGIQTTSVKAYMKQVYGQKEVL
ncbi:hypothetical protein B0I35DRAFT_420298 [Stachybotrys elegans]|uniref:NmrA-like domain-containing protein n=1 Tax=Stachybotrys elegans TaxID=80388 RepID=A0A8K0WXQ3_9HYPO|nr:hypothetical protein B0I35DRAFT_420298 [Stachybotrys elegans]